MNQIVLVLGSCSSFPDIPSFKRFGVNHDCNPW